MANILRNILTRIFGRPVCQKTYGALPILSYNFWWEIPRLKDQAETYHSNTWSNFISNFHTLHTPPKTNISPEKWWDWNMKFSFCKWFLVGRHSFIFLGVSLHDCHDSGPEFPPTSKFLTLSASRDDDIIWVVPLPSNSDHQDYYMFSRDPYKPSFATVTGRGDNPHDITSFGHSQTLAW